MPQDEAVADLRVEHKLLNIKTVDMETMTQVAICTLKNALIQLCQSKGNCQIKLAHFLT
jgi:hypothetical protein